MKSPVRFPALPKNFSLRENYYMVCSDWHFCVSMPFAYILCCVVFGGSPCTVLITDQSSVSNCVRLPIWSSRNFLYHKTLACKFLVTVSVKGVEKMNECKLPKQWPLSLLQTEHYLLLLLINSKGPFINYVRVSRGVDKYLHTLTFWGEGSNPFLRNIFQVDNLY